MLRSRAREFWLAMAAVACSASPEADPPSYDSATLDAYLSALPEADRLSADAPAVEAGSPGALTYGNSALLAVESARFARSINAPALQIVRALRAVVQLPPSLYDSSKREFLWGPWDNEDGFGKVSLYIRENEAGADFRYSYALVRMVDNDLADATPVIWGAATPDADDEDKGVGITLWDIEANEAFEAEHDPAFDADAQHGSGRFVMLYGHHEDGEREALFNVAVFRNFVPDDAGAGERPADLDYFYGRVLESNDRRLDFFDSAISADLCDATADSCFENDSNADAPESLDFLAVFVDGGVGRAEATVRDGDLDAPVSLVECWDAGFDRTFIRLESGGSEVMSAGACAAPMDQSMSSLGLPSLSTIDTDLLSALDCVAQHGVDSCSSQ
jgi:hypothetical protein